MRPFRFFLVVLTSLVLASSCGAGAPGGKSNTVRFTGTHHDFPPFAVASGENLYGQCQSWTLHNEEPLYVNSVHMTADPGWHHSNWVYVSDDMFNGDDGTWRCSDRGFSEVAASTQGSVFFAQSTQSTAETQQFPPNVVLVVPPHSRIIGSVHLVNVTSGALSSKLSFDLGLLPASQVNVRLSPMALTFEEGLVVPASVISDSTVNCNVGASYLGILRHQPDFKIYYVLPHYHQLGTGITATALRSDGSVLGTIFDNTARIGDPLGQTYTTPFDMTGASNIKVTCHYDNGTGTDFHFGNSLMGEMCVLLAYTDSPLTIGGLSMTGGALATPTAGTDPPEYTASCGVVAIRTPDACAAITSCSQCAAAAGCGWCGSSSTCASGTEMGQSVGTCADHWAFDTTACM